MDEDRGGMVCGWLALVAIILVAASALTVLALYAQDSLP